MTGVVTLLVVVVVSAALVLLVEPLLDWLVDRVWPPDLLTRPLPDESVAYAEREGRRWG